jgi:lysozyme
LSLIDFVRAREGYEKDNGDGTYSAYLDTNAKPPVWTIGPGITGPNVFAGVTWTRDQCEAALVGKLATARAQLLALSPNVAWPDGAQDALTDFVYNEGSGNYKGSHVRKCVEAGDWAGVRAHLLDWEFAGGKRLGGLVTRREGEAAMIGAPTGV